MAAGATVAAPAVVVAVGGPEDLVVAAVEKAVAAAAAAAVAAAVYEKAAAAAAVAGPGYCHEAERPRARRGPDETTSTTRRSSRICPAATDCAQAARAKNSKFPPSSLISKSTGHNSSRAYSS
eukprot:2814555-Prymnesium_polylepis.1